jgi:hypothetical protein
LIIFARLASRLASWNELAQLGSLQKRAQIRGSARSRLTSHSEPSRAAPSSSWLASLELIFQPYAEGQKRKRVADVLNKDDEEQLKKKKLKLEPKTDASKKRKATAPKQKAIDEEEETAASPSTTDVEEILKVMTESLPVKLSPFGPHLMKLFQKDKEGS